MSRLNCGIPIFALTRNPPPSPRCRSTVKSSPADEGNDVANDRDGMRYATEQRLIEGASSRRAT